MAFSDSKHLNLDADNILFLHKFNKIYLTLDDYLIAITETRVTRIA